MGVTNYFLTGMILQVVGWLASWLVLFCWSAKMSYLRTECTILTFTSVFGWLGPGEFQFGWRFCGIYITRPKSSWEDEFPVFICEACQRKAAGFVECTQTDGVFFSASCILGDFCILMTSPWKYQSSNLPTTNPESKVRKMKRNLMVAACIMRHKNRVDFDTPAVWGVCHNRLYESVWCNKPGLVFNRISWVLPVTLSFLKVLFGIPKPKKSKNPCVQCYWEEGPHSFTVTKPWCYLATSMVSPWVCNMLNMIPLNMIPTLLYDTPKEYHLENYRMSPGTTCRRSSSRTAKTRPARWCLKAPLRGRISRLSCFLGGNSNIFSFHPLFGEDFQFDYIIFFKGVETTN